jgi:hypothetical protein
MEALAVAADALELRVLSGLQSGAALPLEDMLTVGSDDDADLLLLGDAGDLAGLRVSLAPDGGLTLQALDEGVALASGTMLAAGASMPLMPGEAFRTGDIWLTVRDTSDPWEAWTPPVLAGAVEELPDAGAEPTTSPDESFIAADVRPSPAGRQTRSPAPRPMRTLGSLIVAAGLLSTMLGVAALVRQATEGEASVAPGADPAKTGTSASGGRRATVAVHAVPAVPVAPVAPVAAASAPVAASASTAAASSASAPRAPDVDVIPGATSVRAGGRDQLLVNVPGDGIVILPFDIQEVLLGSASHVTLTDGRRLAPGDRVGEWRLAEIRPGALVFDGPRKVQIGW